MEITFRSRGLFRPSSEQWVYEITFRGQASHSSTPLLGVNAITLSVRFLQGLQKKFGKVAVLSWEGGEGHNMIPAAARVRFCLPDRAKVALRSNSQQRIRVERVPAGWYGTLPWEEAVWSTQTVEALLAPLQKVRDRAFDPPFLTWNVTQLREGKEGWFLTLDLRPLPGQSIQKVVKGLEEKLWKRLGHPGPTWQFRLERDNPALEMDAKDPLVRQVRAALRSARIPVRIAAKPGCSEAGLYRRVGIPSVVIGPGRAAGNIHRPNESISARQLKSAVRFYQAFLERTCF